MFDRILIRLIPIVSARISAERFELIPEVRQAILAADKAGFDIGHDAGYRAGHSKGWSEGYDVGLADGQQGNPPHVDTIEGALGYGP